VGRIEGDMGDVYFDVLIGVGFSRIVVQCERFLLGGEGCVGDNVIERVTTSGWLEW